VSDRVGVEITGTRLRAVALAAWGDRPRAHAEVEWDATHPAASVAALASRMGRVGRIALAIGLDQLHVKHVDLPPASARVRRQMIAVEPDRFFPVQESQVVVGLAGAVAFAFDRATLERWTQAFETWAPVESVEAAPVALARALADADDGTYAFPLGDDATGVVEVRGKALAAARYVTGPARDAARDQSRALPTIRRVDLHLLTAWGAARGLDGDLDVMLIGDAQRRTIERRRVRRLAGAAAACLIAVGFGLWALDRSREDVLARLTGEQAALEPRAAPGAALQAQLAKLDQEDAVSRTVSTSRTDPLRVLAALGERLPRDVTVLNARAIGDEWRIDGTATNAAAILPALDGDPRFQNARFLAATARYREGGKTYESFSLAFRAKPGA
jgi:Tfp pilus assembly protein PilN